MRRMRAILSAALVAASACASQDDEVPASNGASGTAGAPPASVASPRDTASGIIGAASISVDYGRPSRRGREIFGSLVPFDAVWRTGANAATTLVVGAPVEIGGKPLDAGTYTLYSMPARTGWTLIVNGQTGQWGTEYRQDRDLFRVPLTLARAATAVDTFTITVQPGEREGALVFAWDTLQGSVAVRPR